MTNMYDILNKLNSLNPLASEEKPMKKTPVYESVESRGSISEAIKSLESKFKQFKESDNKPDYIDLDKDGNKKEPMKKAARDAKKVKEGYDLPGYGDEATWGGRSPDYDDDYYYCGYGDEEVETEVVAPYDIPNYPEHGLVHAGETMMVTVYVDCDGDDFKIHAVAFGGEDDELIDLNRAGQAWVNNVHDNISERLQKEPPEPDGPDYDLDESTKVEMNFTADDLNRLSKIKDLNQLKSAAFELISKPSQRPMQPQKVEWFKQVLADKPTVNSVMKLMYDLLLSGEGHSVIGTRHSMSPNSYRSKFGEDTMQEGTIWDDDYDENSADEYDEPQDEGFFVALQNEDGSGFVGAIVKEGGKWVERAVSGKAPYNWGGTYMSYLKPHEVMQWIRQDYRRQEVFGPFDSEDEAMEYADGDVYETKSGMMEDEYINPKFEYVDVELSQWRQMVRQQYPDAKIYAAPEEEGGTREAYVGNKFVGDWDGSGGIAGRILKPQESLTEKSKSKAQQRFFGMVHAAQKGKKPASKEVAKVAKSMGKRDVTDFAKTKHKGLPKHVTESRVMEAHSTFDHILQRYPAEVKQFERTQQLDNDLYDALYDYYRNSGEMPYGVAKARSGDPMEWISDRFAKDIGMSHQEELPFNDELDEIAQLAGLNSAGQEPVMDDFGGEAGLKNDSISPLGHQEVRLPEADVEEGNEFSQALAAARASGQKEFEVGGKRYMVKEDVNLSITANGDEDALNLIRKLSGMPVADEPSCSCQQGVDADQDPITGGSDGVEVIELPMEEEREIEYVNTPREKTAPLSAAYPSGSDMHRAKKSYSDKPYRGDNPMAERRVEESLWKKYSDMLKGLTK